MRPLLFGVLIACAGCSHDSPVAPTPACQTNNTSTLFFQNTSTTRTYDISVDNVRVVTGLAPGATSTAVNVVAGVQHSAQFLRSTTVACSGNPIPIRCDSTTLTCAQ